MKKYIFISAILMSLFLLNSCDSKKSNLELIQGTWISVDDENYELKIDEDNWIDIYEGEASIETTFVISEECKDDQSAESISDGTVITTFNEEYTFCYEIVKVDSENLEIIYQDRGNSLIFKRK